MYSGVYTTIHVVPGRPRMSQNRQGQRAEGRIGVPYARYFCALLPPTTSRPATAARTRQSRMICRFFPDRFDFIVPAPKGTRLPGVRLRVRRLTRDEVIPVGGLPALTVERALADLIGIGTDLSLVAGACSVRRAPG